MHKVKRIDVYTDLNNAIEALPDLLELPEFKDLYIVNHTVQRYGMIGIYVYDDDGEEYEDPEYGQDLPRLYSEEITLEINPDFPSHETFYDWNGSQPEYDEDSEGILFTFKNGLIAGIFMPDADMLILCDITHSKEYLPIAKQVLLEIFSHLKKMGYDPYKIFYANLSKLELESIGTDPEFGLIDEEGDLLNAENYYDGLHSKIGCDGSGNQLELRPDPGDENTVVESIRELLMEVAEDGYDVGFNPSISYGGHIHFGYGMSAEPTQDFLDVLDDFFGKKTQYLVERYSYGHLSDYETKPWGFEYRTPSGAIFSNPEIARISLKIARLIGERVGETIEYNYPVEKKDYVKLGLTEQEADYFLKFTSGRKQYRSILGYWKVSYNPIKIVFKDEWDYEVKDRILKAVEKEFKTNEPQGVVYIKLYGLKEERGDVNTIEVESYTKIKHEQMAYDSIGVAYKIRMGENVDTFIQALIEYLKEVL